jgi:formate dehydrogenase major subunit
MATASPTTKMMETKGIPSTRWFDATWRRRDQVEQPTTSGPDGVRPRRQHRHPDAGSANAHREARTAGRRRSASDHLGGAAERKNDTYMLPICTQFECDGSRTASNRSLQWGEQIVEADLRIEERLRVMYMLARKLGFADELFKNIKVENGAVRPRTSCARSIAAASRPAIAASRRSG